MPGRKKDKSIHSGLSMEHLYARQSDCCWLEVEFDNINGKEVYGDLYCTDGETKATTATLLNPSNECMKCISKFVAMLFDNHEVQQ